MPQDEQFIDQKKKFRIGSFVLMKYKKLKKIGLVLAVVLLMIAGVSYWDYTQFQLNATEVTFECGKTLPDFTDYLDMDPDRKDAVIMDVDSELKSTHPRAGEYAVNYQYHGFQKTLLVTLVDSTAPEVTIVEEPVILENESLNVEKYITVADYSDYEVDFDDSQIIYNTAGTYSGLVTVKDRYGNQCDVELPIVIQPLELNLASTTLTLDQSGTGKLEVSTNSHEAVHFHSSNEQVVTVDSSGNVVAVGTGSATISAEVGGKEVTCDVTVNASQPVQTQPSVDHSTPDVSYTVYKTKTGDCYHRANCRYLRKSKIAISLSQAQSEGLRPCSVCNP